MSASAKIRVLVVDDSLTIRRRLAEILGADPELEVVGEAADGRSAIEQCRQLRPDVVTLDMMLPVMTGLAATEYIMAYFPTPILIVSASTNRGELYRTYDALAAGAVDVFEKPDGSETDDEWDRGFCAAVKMVSRIKVITHPRARLQALTPLPTIPDPNDAQKDDRRALKVVALGVSTGGPAALVSVLSQLPAGFTFPLVVVLHLDEVFGSAFAEWLDAQTQHRVATPREGELVAAYEGRVAIAPPARHLTVVGGRFRLTAGAHRHSCRPSVDVLFESLAVEYGAKAAACILTGMGKDGAAGLLAIRKAGGTTIAQDEPSSVVYGMPREAVQLGAAERVLSLDAIGRLLCGLARAEGGD